MPTMSFSNTSNGIMPSNATLTQEFTNLFGDTGGAGQVGTSALSSIASGGNTAALNKALTTSWQQTSNAGAANIKEAFGSSGMGHSTGLAKSLSSYWQGQQGQLQSGLASADLQSQQQTLSAASYLTQIFSGAANNYYSSTSNQQGANVNPVSIFSAMFPGGV